jgi:hypothetical protein
MSVAAARAKPRMRTDEAIMSAASRRAVGRMRRTARKVPKTRRVAATAEGMRAAQSEIPKMLKEIISPQ